MANLLSQNIGTNYKSILNLDATTINTPLDATLRAVTDGMGTSSPLQLSTDQVGISRTVALSAGATNPRLFNEVYTINNSGAQTGTLTGLFLDATETALNGITHNLMDLQVGGVSKVSVSNAGNVFASAFFGASFNANFCVNIYSSTQGVLRLTDYNTGTTFNRIQLGGTTSSFPSIKRNGAAIDFRLADDSNYCDVNGKGFQGTYFYIGSTYYESSRIYIGATTNAKLQPFTSGFSIEQGTSVAINASAIFQLNSTTQGFLPPRMTTTQKNAIATPATGLVVFDTTLAKLAVYTGAGWEAVTSI